MSRIVGRRVRSGDQETESTNQRLLRRGSVSTSAVQNRAVREAQRWPGGLRVRPGDLTAEAVEELDGRYTVGETVTLSGSERDGDGNIVFSQFVLSHLREGFSGLVLPSNSVAFQTAGYPDVIVDLELAEPNGANVTVFVGDRQVGQYRGPSKWRHLDAHLFPLGVVDPREPVRVACDQPLASATVNFRMVEPVGKPEELLDVTEAGYRIAVSAASGVTGISVMRKPVGGVDERIAFTSMPISAGTWYGLRARVDGDRIRVRAWEWGGSEPSGWHVDHVDPTPADSGYAGVATSGPFPTKQDGDQQVDVFSAWIEGGAEQFTDFSGYTTGVRPSDWTVLVTHGPGDWIVEDDASATGGKWLRYGSGSTRGQWLGWQGAGLGLDMEVLARVRHLASSDSANVVLRGSVE